MARVDTSRRLKHWQEGIAALVQIVEEVRVTKGLSSQSQLDGFGAGAFLSNIAEEYLKAYVESVVSYSIAAEVQIQLSRLENYGLWISEGLRAKVFRKRQLLADTHAQLV